MLSGQFFYEPKTDLKKIASIKKKDRNMDGSETQLR